MTIINKKLIEINLECSTAEDVIRHMGNLMLQQGYVKEDYINAVIEREKIYPTGFPGDGISIAIPHTDSKHVVNPTIAIATLKQPVKFSLMGNSEEILSCNIVMLLAIKDPKTQIELLKRLMGVIQNGELLNKIKEAKDQDEVSKLLYALQNN